MKIGCEGYLHGAKTRELRIAVFAESDQVFSLLAGGRGVHDKN